MFTQAAVMEEFRPGVVKDLLARAREARREFCMLMGCMYKSVYVHIQISLSLSLYIYIVIFHAFRAR